MNKKYFHVFEVDSEQDEDYVINTLLDLGCQHARVVTRDWEGEWIEVEIIYDVLPKNFRDQLHDRNVIV